MLAKGKLSEQELEKVAGGNIFDDIGDFFEDAGKTIADAAEDIAKTTLDALEPTIYKVVTQA